MNAASVYDLIKMGRFEDACFRADEEFRADGNVLALRNKILALIELKKFDDAIILSGQIIDLTNGSSDSDFIFGGVAHWLRGDADRAVEGWKAGLSAKYTDAAGGVELPMLLLFAAQKTRNGKLEKEALSMLKKAAPAKRAVNWPGPIAQFLTNQISEERLMERVDSQPVLREKQSCQADFYVGLRFFASGDLEAFRKNLKQCIGHGAVCVVKAEPRLAKGELRILDGQR